MRKKMIISGGVLLLVLASIVAWKYNTNEGIYIKTVQVERGPLYETITVTGKVISQREVAVGSSVPGQLIRVHVKEGDRVPKGKILARLDDREAVSALKKAKANLRLAREEVGQAGRKVERLRRLLEVGGASRQELEDAQAQWEIARAREMVGQEDLRSARTTLDKLNVIAPFAGLVTSRLAQIGQWAAPGSSLFTLVDVDQRQIEATVDAADVPSITVGQTAIISTDAFPDREWTETVKRVAPATLRGVTPRGEVPTNTVSVRISLGAEAPPLRFGQQVDAKIRIASSPHALKLPFGVIIAREGKTWVAVIREARVHYVPVVTGLEDLTHTEILQGLSAGQEVILPGGKILQEGDRVQPIIGKKPA